MAKIVEVVAKVAPSARSNYVDAFRGGDALLAQFAITTPLRASHFLAQVLHETGGGRVLEESLGYTTAKRLMEIFGIGRHSAAIRPEEVDGLLGNPEALAERVYGLGNPRKARELGNIKKGDGYKYRGRGALQTTGGANYQRMGDKSGIDFFGQPDLLTAAQHVLKPALHEWDEGHLNEAADRNDIRTITRRINGGYNGLPDRQAWLDKVYALLSKPSAPEPWAAAVPDEGTHWLQRALNDLGAEPRLKVDGRYGPDTTEAVKAFQKLAKVKVDGVAGEVTRAAIRLRLAAIRGG